MSERNFVRDGNIVSANGNHFIELCEYGDCAVLMRFFGGDRSYSHWRLNCQPYVVASGYNKKDGTWCSGAYFTDLFDAVDYAKAKACMYHFSYYRIKEIASKVIDGLYEDDSETTREYCKDVIKMSEEEMDYFGLTVIE